MALLLLDVDDGADEVDDDDKNVQDEWEGLCLFACREPWSSSGVRRLVLVLKGGEAHRQ